MTPARVQFAPAQFRRLVQAVLALFFVNGLLMGAWVGALPGLRHRVGTDSAGIGWLLIAAGLGAIVSMQVAGHLSDRTSARTPAFLGVSIIGIGELAASLAPDYALLCGAAVVIGCGNGCMGVAMNALGVDAETISSRKVMSRLHAMASLGGFAGASIIVAVAHLAPVANSDPRRALWCAAAAAALGVTVLTRLAPHPVTPRHAMSSDKPSPPRMAPQAWLLGVMALFFGFTEGAAVDWSSIYVTEVEKVSPAAGAVGLLCVTLSMVSVRLLGDHVVRRWGSTRTMRCASPLAAVGFLLTSTCHALLLVLGGWLLVGFGVALIAPQIYGLAGRLGGGRTLAVVSGFGYAAFLTGPGLIGWLASHVGIQHAMAIPLGTSVLLAIMTYLPVLEPRSSQRG